MAREFERQNLRIITIDDTRAIHDDYRRVLGGEEVDDVLDDLEKEFFGETEEKALSENYEIDSAEQGEAGFEMVKSAYESGNPYALAFVDMRMPPGWDGFKTIQQMWKYDPEIQVVICTAYSDSSWSEIFGTLGQPDRLLVLKKPFDPIELKQLASALTSKWELTRRANTENDRLNALVTKATDDRKEVQAQNLQTQKLESIGRLAAGVAHEINTPTQYVTDNISYLSESIDGILPLIAQYQNLAAAAKAENFAPDLRSKIDDIEEEIDLEFLIEEMPSAAAQAITGIKRISQIVTAMQEFSHPGQMELTPVNINRMIESTMTIARNEWKYVAELELALQEDLPLVPCIADEFGRVVLNMIVNAAHAIEEARVEDPDREGLIRISTEVEGDWAVMRISDTGAGIPDEIRDKIFDPFFTTKGVNEGTGQGLAIARSAVVDKHGGTVDCESSPAGTTFIVRLPLVVAAVSEEQDVAAAGPGDASD